MNCRIMGLWCVVVWGLAIPCHGALLQDQINELQPDQWGISLLYHGASRAQTFTVGRTGRLARIDVGLTGAQQASPYWVDIAIATVANGVPDFDSILASRRLYSEDISLPSLAIPKYSISADFTSSDIQVTAGDMVALVVASNVPPLGPPTNVFGLWHSASSYPNGQTYYRRNREVSEGLGDFHFRTFVEVPEQVSANLSLMAIVCGGWYALSRRQ